MTTASTSDDFPWPSSEMGLLSGEHSPPLDDANACFQMAPNWTAYRAAYEEATDLLVPGASRDMDYLIYPLLFCARQALELGLKEMIQILHTRQGKEPSYPKTHRLYDLWIAVKRAAVAAGFDLDESSNHFDRLIAEFDALDPLSDRFRYPEDRKGDPSHDRRDESLPSIVDVAKLHRSSKAMFNYINGSSDYFEETHLGSG